MNTATLLHSFSPLLTALLLVLITTSDVTPPPSSPMPGGCADSVISFSPCLPYISAPPNDLSDQPSSQCCDIYDEAFDSGEAECLCYLVRQSTLLGFPLNASKLLSLSDLCSLNNNTQGSQPNDTNPSLQFICSGKNMYIHQVVMRAKNRFGTSDEDDDMRREHRSAQQQALQNQILEADQDQQEEEEHTTHVHEEEPTTASFDGHYVAQICFALVFIFMAWYLRYRALTLRKWDWLEGGFSRHGV